TADRWKDRLLGGNRVYDGPLHVTWYGTGNNVQLVGDTPRRVCRVCLESKMERPEERSDVKYPNLRQHVQGRRGECLSAALTLPRAWYAADRPRHGLTPWGSYEGWSEVVREAVVFAGYPDPGLARMSLAPSGDREAEALAALMDGLQGMDGQVAGKTTVEI